MNSSGEEPMRILVADDDLVLSHALEHRLREQGYDVVVARDAIQAWQMVQREKPDLIVLDIKMPGGSGLAVLRRMKHNLNARKVSVIVITATEEQSTIQQILALQPDAFLRKPFKLADLDFEISRQLVALEIARSAAPKIPKGAA
jgi:CheY-like chemotaxis protein